MNDQKNQVDKLLIDLQERAKELNCLYKLEELLSNSDLQLEDLFHSIIRIIPPGWQYPEICQAQITYNEMVFRPDDFIETTQVLVADISVQDKKVGRICVSYTQEVPRGEDGPFLKEEIKLIETIADRIGHTILYRNLRSVSNEWERMKSDLAHKKGSEWIAIVDMLLKTDRKLFIFIAQKMLHYLYLNGIDEADQLIQKFGVNTARAEFEDVNRPSQKKTMDNILTLGQEIFKVASGHFNNDRILTNIQNWIQEEKSRFLVKAIDDPNSSITEIIDAITRYHYLVSEGIELSNSIMNGLRVSLIRRFFSDQLDYIKIAKQFIDVADYFEIVRNIIFPSNSHGRLGGKSAGLFLAHQIVRKCKNHTALFSNLKVPRTWYVTSDGLINFLYYNNLEEVIEQKYKDIDEIHIEYQNIIQMFKISHLPPEIMKGLSAILDDIGERPVIVRSSSLLEDRLGAAFSGKYKSLFLANQGTKQQRLDALADAITEVYASTFSPDPIEYRKERGLLDFFEEMGIMIQEVVGRRVGRYFIPAFSGVALSNNEFRWSPRIKREDGLLRMVPGLGTRAVDRTADDYPMLIAPGMPDLRVNVTPEEIMRYSPKYIDVINCENNSFETVAVADLLMECGGSYPMIGQIVSLQRDNEIQKPTSLFNIDFEKDDLVVTFDGLVSKTPFLEQISTLLHLLQDKIDVPVDVEFAHDGENLYLLQCRPQSYTKETLPSPIPRDIPATHQVFSAHRFISNGFVPDITHIVYIVPEAYQRISGLMEMQRVGRAVSRLNKILPKRRFILMGPGRWGSRGDIKLGVNVTYSDINNTAMLIEIARKKGNYIPDLSFGTHFFQDLVESSIRYLPLYPDDTEVVFNERILLSAASVFPDLVPDFADLSDVIRVIDVPEISDGLILRVLMNADLDESIAILAHPETRENYDIAKETQIQYSSDDFWRWRYHMAEQIASKLDPHRFGVQGFYIFGSTKNATAGPGSDIDILVHFRGTADQRKALENWLEGWSLNLSEMNYLKTGYRTDGLLDVHLITDDDIKKKTSYAIKIGAVTDAARELTLKKVK